MSKDFEVGKGTLDNKPKTTGFKVTSERLRKGKENRLAHRSSLDFRIDKKNVCEPKKRAAKKTPIKELKTVLVQSRTAEAMLEATDNLEIYYDAQVVSSQFYALDDKLIIALNPNRPKGDLLNTLAKELRHAWQHNKGALVNPMNYEPDAAILINRAQQSDVLVTSIKVAWELKLVGEPEAWEFLAASSFSGMTRSFEVKAQKDFRSLNNGEASRDAYDRFFEEKSAKIFDKKIIHQMLLDDKGYMKNAEKTPVADMMLFSKLGDMPHSANYLSGGRVLPTEEAYTKIEDRSNANFLWFIKFERSFQEREMRMVEETTQTSAEVVDFSSVLTQRSTSEDRVR